MRPLTDHDKRTLRVGLAIVLAYLFVFYGTRAWTHLEAGRAEYHRLLQHARQLKQELRPYETKALLLQELKAKYHLEPGKLSPTTLVAEASGAIQKAAS